MTTQTDSENTLVPASTRISSQLAKRIEVVCEARKWRTAHAIREALEIGLALLEKEQQAAPRQARAKAA